MKKRWLEAFGRMTYGIYVLTARVDEIINGMIASWVAQVSYDPPMIMAAVHPNRYSHGLIEKSGFFALHVLDRSQKAMLQRFKGPDPGKKFSGTPWHYGKTGAPVLTDCPAWFELEVKARHTPGNHTLFFGEVVDAGVHSEGTPLCTLDYDGLYTGKV
ncbi:MAG: flavin reductase family protein [Deltaproteobacteria bacterium]|nr:flavin reductase family protein [Deltaproteobacteria bacterium]